MKQVFLHIGFGKCGTTAIQRFAHTNFKDNEQIYLPETGWWQEGEGHHHLANNLNKEIGLDKLTEKWQTVAEELLSAGATSGFISSEQFCFLNHDEVSRIYQVLSLYDWEVKVIFFIRSQLELALSAYMQSFKHSSYSDVGNFESYLSRHKHAFDFQQRIAAWEELFGFNNLIVRLYDRSLFNDVVQELCHMLDLAFDTENQKKSGSKKANLSIAPEFIDLIQFFDTIHRPDSSERAKFISLLIAASDKLSKGSSGIKLFSTVEQLIVDLYQAKNEAFASKFLTIKEKEALMQSFIR